MRGVCALNMEAMSVLLKNDNELETTTSTNDEQRRFCNRKCLKITKEKHYAST
jgi:hypothetical protein